MLQRTIQLNVSGQGASLPEPFIEALKHRLQETNAATVFALTSKIEKADGTVGIRIIETYARSIRFRFQEKGSSLSWTCLLSWNGGGGELIGQVGDFLKTMLVPVAPKKAPQPVREPQIKKENASPPQRLRSVSADPRHASQLIDRLFALHPEGEVTKKQIHAVLIAEYGYKGAGAGCALRSLMRAGCLEDAGDGRARLRRVVVVDGNGPCDLIEKQLERLMDLALYRRRGINRTELRKEVLKNKNACEKALRKLRAMKALC